MILCKACQTTKCRIIKPTGIGEVTDKIKNPEETNFIVCHKKDCSYLKKLLENSIEV